MREDKYLATRAVLKALQGDAMPECTFVLSSHSDALIAKLKKEYGGVEESSGRMRIRLSNSSHAPQHTVVVEEVNDLWKSLLLDVDPPMMYNMERQTV